MILGDVMIIYAGTENMQPRQQVTGRLYQMSSSWKWNLPNFRIEI